MGKILQPHNWKLDVNTKGELMVCNFSTVDLAKEYGTPLHVLNELRLGETARNFKESVQTVYTGKSSVHYAFKCNSVPTVIQTIRSAGLKAEVMSEFELDLALHMGYEGEEIIVNGPCKTDSFLCKCLNKGVRFIIVDSLNELKALNQICVAERKDADILFRINPNYTPKGMNTGAATGSRKGCAFGLDFKGGEVSAGVNLLKDMKHVNFHGFHFHIGTGIRDPKDYSKALRCLGKLRAIARSAGLTVRVVDVGGGFASMTTREMTNRELLFYQGFELLPSGIKQNIYPTFKDFAREISDTILQYFPTDELPELLYEPGRCIVSPNQFLLLTVYRVKERPGIRKWLITDGGLGTVTLPTFYEYHEIFLCNDAFRPRTEKVTIVGPVCFASDIVYRNKLMPKVYPEEVLAIMDSGAYFTSMESSFGFPRPAIISVSRYSHCLIRRAERFEDMICRDFFSNQISKEVTHEICDHKE
jgi:diaminopimelate decarboxylase